ncbi:MAG: methionyl-tRNA formyltransferase, partial [bacterium]
AYAQIISEEILNLPEYGCVNIHGSLLPKYRGASCVQAAIINGDKESGITIIKMDENLDTGQIIAQKKIEIENFDTAETLSDKLSALGGEFIVSILKKYINNEIKLINQDDNSASYAKKLKKNDGRIDWNKTAEEIEKFTRAMHSWPGAFTEIEKLKKTLKIIPPVAIIDINKYKNNELFVYEKKLAVQCKKNSIVIDRLQLEGKKETSSEEFLRGYGEKINIEKNKI